MLKKCDEQRTANSEQTDSTVYRVAAQLITNTHQYNNTHILKELAGMRPPSSKRPHTNKSKLPLANHTKSISTGSGPPPESLLAEVIFSVSSCN